MYDSFVEENTNVNELIAVSFEFLLWLGPWYASCWHYLWSLTRWSCIVNLEGLA